MTTITTTARRIAKTLNSHANMSTGWAVIFDADGSEIDSHQAGMWYANPADVIHGAHTFIGGNHQHYTARRVQDAIDQAAAEDELLAGLTPADLYGADL